MVLSNIHVFFSCFKPSFCVCPPILWHHVRYVLFIHRTVVGYECYGPENMTQDHTYLSTNTTWSQRTYFYSKNPQISATKPQNILSLWPVQCVLTELQTDDTLCSLRLKRSLLFRGSAEKCRTGQTQWAACCWNLLHGRTAGGRKPCISCFRSALIYFWLALTGFHE